MEGEIKTFLDKWKLRVSSATRDSKGSSSDWREMTADGNLDRSSKQWSPEEVRFEESHYLERRAAGRIWEEEEPYTKYVNRDG